MSLRFAFFFFLCAPAFAQSVKYSSPQSMQSRGAPIAQGEWVSSAISQGLTPSFPFAADLTATQSVEKFVQTLRFVNRGSDYVCFAPAPKIGTCSTSCLASTITCDGSVTDGDAIPAGTAYSIALAGDLCPCLVAKTAATPVGVVRIGRFPW